MVSKLRALPDADLRPTLGDRSFSNQQEDTMAGRKKSGRKYGKAAGKSVKSAMHRKKKGTLKSGKGGKGGRVKSRKQAIAIGLSEAREKGAKVPRKKAA
jgi:type IV secretory pathway TrbL component